MAGNTRRQHLRLLQSIRQAQATHTIATRTDEHTLLMSSCGAHSMIESSASKHPFSTCRNVMLETTSPFRRTRDARSPTPRPFHAQCPNQTLCENRSKWTFFRNRLVDTAYATRTRSSHHWVAEYHLRRIGADLNIKTDLGEVWIQCEGIAQKSYVCYPVSKRHPHGYQAGLHTLLGAGGP